MQQPSCAFLLELQPLTVCSVITLALHCTSQILSLKLYTQAAGPTIVLRLLTACFNRKHQTRQEIDPLFSFLSLSLSADDG
jgi:hypothetical protein